MKKINQTLANYIGSKCNIKLSFFSAFLIVVTMMSAGCKKSETTSDSSNTTSGQATQFNLRMTDAPGDYDEVNIDIIGAEVHSDVNGWVPLKINAGIYNLLEFVNKKDTLIASGQVAVGKVSQIRLILGENNTVVIDSIPYKLTTPSAQQSGLKLQVNAELVSGVAYEMLIDFDADKSIVKTGNGKFMLKPVIRVISSAIDGGIEGIVMPLAAQPTIYAIYGTDTFSTAADATTGGFFIGGLQTGSYKVVIAPKSPYTDTAFTGVSVNKGAITNMGTITVK